MQKRLLIDESAPPTHIRRIDGAERDAVRVKQRSQFQSPFSDRFPVTGHTGGQDETKEKPTPVAYEEQRGPLSQARLQKNDDTVSTNVGTSGLRRVDRLPSWEGGPRITERQKDGGGTVLAISSEHTQGKDDLINRKNLERSPGNPVTGSLKCSTQALRATTLREKGERETPHNEGTGTEPKKSYTMPFPGSNYRSSSYRGTATTGAAAAVRVQKKTI